MFNQIARRGICFIPLTMTALLTCTVAAQQSSAGRPSGRSYQAIRSDYAKADFQFLQSISPDGNLHGIVEFGQVLDGRNFSTPQSRRATAAKAVPAINRLQALTREMEPAAPDLEKKLNAQDATFYGIVKLAVDDTPAKESNAQTIAAGGPDAPLAAVMRAAADYLAGGHDAAIQSAAIDHLEQAMKMIGQEAPVDYVPAIFQKNAPAPEVCDRLVALLKADTHCHFSQTVAHDVAGYARRIQLSKNPPLTIEGTLLDGSKFSTATWKGKVILVDFWGTKCAPCLAEMPHLLGLYRANHAKGLEVLGCPGDDAVSLRAFLAKNPGCPWQQAMNPANPLVDSNEDSFGLQGFPTTYLIDRNGILRRMHYGGADKDLDSEIARLLARSP